MEFKKFKLNHLTIDNQHKQLFKLNDELLTDDMSEEKLDEILERLEDYILYHFTTEEVLMLENNFIEGSIEHISEHEFFKLKLIKLKESKDAKEINRFINDWITQHINKSDKKLVKFLTK